MILQALTRYYEDLLAEGKISRPGWVTAKVSYGLVLDEEGRLLQAVPLLEEVDTGKKKKLVPRNMEVPAQVKRAVNIAPNFLCDNSSYLLGADSKGKPERTADCFAAAKELHLKLLAEADSPAARAVKGFFESWDPQTASAHPALSEGWEEILKGGNLIFWFRGGAVTEDSAVREAWQRQYEAGNGETETGVCLVTGHHGLIARLHPNIQGIAGALPTGASLVSFKEPSFCSYGHEQGMNAPTSVYATHAYTVALNTLLADKGRVCRIGDTTVLYWAEGGGTGYQDCAWMSMFGNVSGQEANYREGDILSTLKNLSKGKSVDWDGERLDPDTRFYVLGLAPNAARLSVRFFWQNSFGTLARNVANHYERLEIVKSAKARKFLSIGALLRETVRNNINTNVRVPESQSLSNSSDVSAEDDLNARTPKSQPRLAGDLMLAILNDTPYPATLLYGVALRIRAERTVTRGRAAIIKAYYLKNSRDENLKEVMTVKLNDTTNNTPYLLGRLFSVLEAVQEAANSKSTIRDRYFNAASATPANVFPLLLNLAQKHLAKLDKGQEVYYDKQITAICGMIGETLPKRMNLQDQSTFQLGYYHETQKRYTPKEG